MYLMQIVHAERYLANIPTTNILVKGIGINKQPSHVSHLANIPTANILVKGICVRKHILHIGLLLVMPILMSLKIQPKLGL
jgi:hypothetical protein